MSEQLTDAQMGFLARFGGRGWLAATRDDPTEQEAVDAGLRKRWLRRELGEVHVTPKGRVALDDWASNEAAFEQMNRKLP